jgi:hypothetical protein
VIDDNARDFRPLAGDSNRRNMEKEWCSDNKPGNQAASFHRRENTGLGGVSQQAEL